MSLEADLLGGSISELVKEEGNIVGQPGGGPLATKVQKIGQQRFIAATQGTADAAGECTLAFGAPSVGYAWLIERLAVVGDGAATFYVNSVDDVNIVDYTPSATLDIADESSPIYVPGGQFFICVFTGAAVGTVCTARMQAELVADTV